MEDNTFLRVNEQPITVDKALEYLQSSGQLGSFVGEIIRQYVLEQELQARQAEKIDPSSIEKAINQFRHENQLIESGSFQQWLIDRQIDYDTFVQQTITSLKFQQLVSEVTEPKLQEYFIDKKLFLDRVVLSRLVVEDKELAEELKYQVVEEEAKFEELVQEYSLTEDSVVNGMMGAISRGKLPDIIRSAVDSGNSGDLLGPIQMEPRWCLFRIEKILPASLADIEIKQLLQKEIFEEWVGEKIRNMKVQMQLSL